MPTIYKFLRNRELLVFGAGLGLGAYSMYELSDKSNKINKTVEMAIFFIILLIVGLYIAKRRKLVKL
ncbi:hypothetical protein Metvu_1035 [Methanocaldococcus vulcanius M7]|uniref:Uncharacterized protein n=1 Tax=Methanocaldococcus vulcanius (strain ATCC 700851 / DSM 12094 / M7) TaxID=579137 RepID=C9RH41_METVM|nr:hypothetical protein [Methanocaldococcus vulcanius]ACX72893.1 hypothetical protein Metvu_1035 [Methanocaldococcus vulcanius M7]